MGSQFVTKLANLYKGYGSVSALESIALWCGPPSSQRPHRQLKSQEHIKYLEHRLLRWCEGDITALLNEGLMIQQHLEHSCHLTSADNSRVVVRLVFHGKIKVAMWFLMEQS